MIQCVYPLRSIHYMHGCIPRYVAKVGEGGREPCRYVAPDLCLSHSNTRRGKGLYREPKGLFRKTCLVTVYVLVRRWGRVANHSSSMRYTR